MATLTSYEGSNDDYENNGTSSNHPGQSFQFQTSDGIITGCSIYGGQGSSASGTCKVELKTTSPTGTVVATTGTFNTNTLTAYGTPQWNDLTFSTPYSATKDTTYYLVFTAVTGSTTNETRWSVDQTSPTYSYGKYYLGSTPNANYDRNFRIYGTQAVNYTLTMDAGSFILTGIDTILTSARSIVCSVGSYTLTGIDVILNRAIIMAMGVGSYILTGIDAIFTFFRWTHDTKPTTSWANDTEPTTSFTNDTKPTTN